MGKKGKILLVIMSALFACLLLSTATTTVAVGDWGNLRPGDEMRWKAEYEEYDMTTIVQYEIIEISGSDITYRYEYTYLYNGYTYDYDGTDTDEDYLGELLISQSYLQKMQADADADDDMQWTATTYNFEGTNCKVFHLKILTYYGELVNYWWDQGTGILLEATAVVDGYTNSIELQSTTANLTKAGICMGTILIGLISVATLVSLSMVRYWKKKKL